MKFDFFSATCQKPCIVWCDPSDLKISWKEPSKFREKTQKEAHTKRVIAVQKLQAETERGKYILSHL